MVRGLWVMRMNCVFLLEFLQRIDEAPDVRLIQGGVHLVQHADGRRVRLQQCDEQQRSAVSVRSPPESMAMALTRLPGG